MQEPVTWKTWTGCIAIIALFIFLFSLAGRVENAKAYTAAQQSAIAKCHRIHYYKYTPLSLCRALASSARPSGTPLAWTYDSNLMRLLWHESSYNYYARNPSSGACSWFQFLPCRCTHSMIEQATCGRRYIYRRYGTPTKAWHFWLYEAPKYNGTHWY